MKISELPGWLAGRSKTPVGMGRAMSRAYWRWSHKYVLPKVGLNIHKAWIIQINPSFITFLLYRIVLNGILFFYSIRAWHQAFSLLLDGLHYGTFSTLPNTGNIEITNISGKSIENL